MSFYRCIQGDYTDTKQKGLVISAADLEDPDSFDDMVEAGLLELSPDGLRIEQVLGGTLLTDVEALTPITKDVLDKIQKETSEVPKNEGEAAKESETFDSRSKCAGYNNNDRREWNDSY